MTSLGLRFSAGSARVGIAELPQPGKSLSSFHRSEQVVNQHARIHFSQIQCPAEKGERSSVQYSSGGRQKKKSPSGAAGGRLDCQSLQSIAVADDQRRSIQTNQLFFLKI